jgi:transposase
MTTTEPSLTRPPDCPTDRDHLSISRYTVGEYLRRAAVVGITWPVPSELDDTALERKLFTPPGAMATETARPQPDWVPIHAEMRRAGVTLLLLWEEYRARQPDGYGYSRFCHLYAAWRGRLSPTMRQSHPVGERFVRRLCRANP